VNSPSWEQVPFLSPDGLLLLFASDRPGGYGNYDIWMTRRASHTASWEPALNLGPIINSPEVDFGPCLAPDGRALYFAWDYPDRRDTPLKAPIIPILDFNGDEIINLADLAMLIRSWATGETFCDIGPMPWGDGKVDIEDLKAFISCWQKENSVRSQDSR
jgi:hypothetical protein